MCLKSHPVLKTKTGRGTSGEWRKRARADRLLPDAGLPGAELVPREPAVGGLGAERPCWLSSHPAASPTGRSVCWRLGTRQRLKKQKYPQMFLQQSAESWAETRLTVCLEGCLPALGLLFFKRQMKKILTRILEMSLPRN